MTLPLQQFERLLSVELIMTPQERLRCVDVGASLTAVREALGEDFSQVPVRAGGKPLGILTRAQVLALGNEALCVDASLVTAVPTLTSQSPLSSAIRALLESECVLIEDTEGTLAGLIHYSDLNRHPVRLLFYFLLADLEMRLAAAINDAFVEDEGWVRHLSEHRQVQVLGIAEWERRRDMQIDTVEATELRDVVDVAERVSDVQVRVGLDKMRARWLRSFIALRNSTMHPVRRLVRKHEDVKDLHMKLARLQELAASAGHTNA